jgi:hypothetical protein
LERQKEPNLIDRGSCEFTTAPMITGETVPVTNVDMTWERSSDFAYQGTYSWKITKTAAGALAKAAAFVDSFDVNDMHGTKAGATYEISTRFLLPTASGISPSECELIVFQSISGGGFAVIERLAATLLDTWEEITFQFSLDDNATGFYGYVIMASTASNGEYYYVDNYLMEEITPGLSKAIPDFRHQNMMDRGDCESDTPPMIFNETVPVLGDATFDKSAEEADIGNFSRKFIKTIAAGTASRVVIVDSESSIDLHGFIPGFEYAISSRIKLPSASGMLISEAGLAVYEYIGSFTQVDISNPTVLDTWELLSFSFVIDVIATAVVIQFRAESTAALNEYFYVDNIQLELKTKIPLSFGKYRLENIRQDYWKVAADCDTLVGWDTTGIATTTLTLSTTRVLTGRRSLEINTGNGSLDEFIEFDVDPKIPFPIAARIFIYFEAAATPIIITYYDSDGNTASVQFNAIDDVLEANQPPVDDLEVTDSSGPTTDLFGVNFSTSATNDEWTRLERDVTSLKDVVKVRITFKTDSVATLYIDRIDSQADMYNFADLFLEEAIYNLSKVGLFANLHFGESEPSLVDEIISKVEDGNVALQVFSKQ